MSDENNRSLSLNVNVAGVPEIAEKAGEISQDTIDSGKKFVGSICSPAAEEIGFFLQDKVREWRVRNFVKFVGKLKRQREHLKIDAEYQINPRLMIDILDGVSVQEDGALQDWWAGITLSALSDRPGDLALPFVQTMGKITTLQAKIFRFGCINAKIVVGENGLIFSENLNVELEKLKEATDCTDINLLDRETDLLREHGLIGGGFEAVATEIGIELSPSLFGLEFFAKCNGHSDSLTNFYEKSDLLPCKHCGYFH